MTTNAAVAPLSPHRRGALRPEEMLLGGYLVALACCVVATGAPMPRLFRNPVALIALVGLCALVFRRALRRARLQLPVAAARATAWRQVRSTARDFLPFVFTIALYEMLHDLTPILRPHVVDGHLIAADRALFGVDPSVWLGRAASPPLTAALLGCYLSFFVAAPLLACALYWRGQRAHFRTLMVALCAMSAIGFLGYVLVPAIGPYAYQGAQFHDRVPGGGSHAVIAIIDALKGDARDCFPSLHTAQTTIVLVVAWRAWRRFFWLYLPVALGLYVSTMYLRFHYGVDVIAGFVTAVLALLLGRAVRLRLDPRPDPAP